MPHRRHSSHSRHMCMYRLEHYSTCLIDIVTLLQSNVELNPILRCQDGFHRQDWVTTCEYSANAMHWTHWTALDCDPSSNPLPLNMRKSGAAHLLCGMSDSMTSNTHHCPKPQTLQILSWNMLLWDDNVNLCATLCAKVYVCTRCSERRFSQLLLI